MSFVRTIGLAGLTVCLASSAHAGPKAGGVAEARAAIEAANAKFSKAVEAGDADAVAALYTADAIAFPPDHDMVKGRKAIGEFWKATQQSGVKSAVLTTVDVGRSGDVAYEVGTVLLTIQPPDKAATTASAKYVVVWKRQADGSWQLHRDIWNSLPAGK
ncbi:MAG TPA: SgcJ/EcaC family oxidoreductase [Candidatus Binatia bacterium]|nr:SgcJ/EcaC family oxidoreductase [Candidatus Binatia bacterium]